MRKHFCAFLMAFAAIHLGSTPGTSPTDQKRIQAAVLDAATQQPVSGARVWLAGSADSAVFTDEQGQFRLDLQGCKVRCQLLVYSPRYLDHQTTLSKADREVNLDNILLIPAPGKVTGVLQDSDGQRLSGASINVIGQSDSMLQRLTTSDPKGRFRVERLPCEWFLSVSAELEGYVPFTEKLKACTIEPVRSRHRDLGTIVLVKEVPVHGKILNVQGEPIPHAKVLRDDSLRAARFKNGREVLEEVAVADEKGNFSIRGLARGEIFYGEVRAPDYVPQRIELIAEPDRPSTRVVLRPAACLEGSVEDQQGEPVAGVEVTLRKLGVEDLGTITGLGRPTARSAIDGTFQLRDLEPGDYRVLPRSRELVQTLGHLLKIQADEECFTVTLQVERGVMPRGRVLAPDGAPLQGATVRILDPNPPRDRPLRAPGEITDPEGHFRLPPVSPGEISISVSHLDFRSLRRTVDLDEDTWLEFRFEEPAGTTIWGSVQDRSGSGIANASIQLLPLYGGVSHGASSGADGTFSITNVPTGTYRVVGSWQDRIFTDPDRIFPVRAQGNEPLQLLALPGVEVTGRLLGPTRDVLARAQVAAEAQRQVVGEVRSDGSFSIGPLPPGLWELKASLPDGRTVGAAVVLAENQRQAQVDLEFEPAISMVVEVLRAERPLLGAEVNLQPVGRRQMHTATTNQLGQAHFSDLQQGPHRLEVLDPATLKLLHQEEIVATEGALQIISLEAGELRGLVRLADSGDPLADVLVTVESTIDSRKANPFRYTTNLSGEFHIDSLPPGRWRIIARKEGFTPQEATVALLPGESAEVLLELVPGTGLQIRFPSAPPLGFLEQIRVTFLDPAGNSVFVDNRILLPGGRLEVPAAPAGLWDVLIATNGGMLTAELRSVRVPGPEVTANFEQRGGLQIRVLEWIARGSEGTVEFLDAAGRHPVGFPPQTIPGRGEVLGIPPGIWTVLVQSEPPREENSPFRSVVEIRPGEVQTLILD